MNLNWEIVAAFVVVALILGVLAHKFLASPTVSASAKIITDAKTMASYVDAHLKSASSAAKADAESIAQHVAGAFHSHPAAPAADADAPLPAAASGTVDSGGTAAVVTLWNDRVTAKHAELDAIIAAGKQAQAFKDALTAKQAELDQLTVVA